MKPTILANLYHASFGDKPGTARSYYIFTDIRTGEKTHGEVFNSTLEPKKYTYP